MAQRSWTELLRGMGCRWGLGDGGRQAGKGCSEKERGGSWTYTGRVAELQLPRLLNGWKFR